MEGEPAIDRPNWKADGTARVAHRGVWRIHAGWPAAPSEAGAIVEMRVRLPDPPPRSPSLPLEGKRRRSAARLPAWSSKPCSPGSTPGWGAAHPGLFDSRRRALRPLTRTGIGARVTRRTRSLPCRACLVVGRVSSRDWEGALRLASWRAADEDSLPPVPIRGGIAKDVEILVDVDVDALLASGVRNTTDRSSIARTTSCSRAGNSPRRSGRARGRSGRATPRTVRRTRRSWDSARSPAPARMFGSSPGHRSRSRAWCHATTDAQWGVELIRSVRVRLRDDLEHDAAHIVGPHRDRSRDACRGPSCGWPSLERAAAAAGPREPIVAEGRIGDCVFRNHESRRSSLPQDAAPEAPGEEEDARAPPARDEIALGGATSSRLGSASEGSCSQEGRSHEGRADPSSAAAEGRSMTSDRESAGMPIRPESRRSRCR
jgi:hypothetical protein